MQHKKKTQQKSSNTADKKAVAQKVSFKGAACHNGYMYIYHMWGPSTSLETEHKS